MKLITWTIIFFTVKPLITDILPSSLRRQHHRHCMCCWSVTLIFNQSLSTRISPDKFQLMKQAPHHRPLCWRIHRWPVTSPHKWPATRKSFHFMTSSCKTRTHIKLTLYTSIIIIIVITICLCVLYSYDVYIVSIGNCKRLIYMDMVGALR